MRFNRILILWLLLISVIQFQAQNAKPYPLLRQKGTTVQLILDDEPFLILGGELGNSSASSNCDIERVFPKLERMGLNTVLVPAYWDLIEPEEGKYDFTLIEKVIKQARENNLKVVFLWFGAWKNSMSCYAPLWFKQNYKTYPRTYTKEGKPLEMASPFSKNVLKADTRAFSRLMRYIKSIDEEEHTVVMMQIENEVGMLEEARDYSKKANALFKRQISETLLNYLVENKEKLHPFLLQKWESQGFKTEGNWEEIFGSDLYTDELFMAWFYAQYVEELAKSGKTIYNIPMYVNAAMNSRDRKPGEYPSAGPLAHLIDVWRCGAPSIDFLAPDLYDKGFAGWAAQYKLHNNPLFIPEVRLSKNNGVQAFYVFGEYDAIGYSPFSIESGSDDPKEKLVKAYMRLRELMPIITKHQGEGVMNGLLFDQENKERILFYDDLRITCRHYFTLPWDSRAKDGRDWPEGGGIIIRLNPDEYLVAGSGFVVEFEKKSEWTSIESKDLGEDGFLNKGGATAMERAWTGGLRAGIGAVDEVSIDEEGTFNYIRRLNGDQTHQGRHVRISVDDFSILHVRLYEYK